MADIIPINKANVPAAFAAAFADNTYEDNLGAGIQSSFGVISYRGRVWRLGYKGESHIVKNTDGDPAAALKVVILDAAAQISKTFYAKKYEEGMDDAPDCYSTNGITPDAAVTSPQCKTCAACPQNAWGSRITDAGKKVKACQDTKRLAVTPYPDIENRAFGGPVLLRVPPASLGNLKAYAVKLQAAGLPPYAVVTRISFDVEASYPLLKFDYVEAITNNDIATKIMEQRDADQITRILQEGSDAAPAPSPTATAAPRTPPAEPVVVPEGEPSAPSAPTTPEEPPFATAETGTSTVTVAEEAPTTEQSVDDIVGGLLAGD